MLSQDQTRYLLEKCEDALGQSLDGVRSNLRGKNRLHFIWELIVLNALIPIAKVEYEPATPGRKRLDFRLQLEGGEVVWMDAAWLEGRLSKEERAVDRFLDQLYKRLHERGVPPSRVRWRIDGVKSGVGRVPRVPSEHELGKFFQISEMRNFIDRASEGPEEAFSCDLRPRGYTIVLEYKPVTPGPNSGGSGLPSEMPTEVGEHAVYRLLIDKGRKAKAAKISEPFLVCVGGRHVRPLTRSISDFGHITREHAAQSAFGKYTTLSGVILCPFVDNSPSAGFGIRAEPILHLNGAAKCLIQSNVLEKLLQANFNEIRFRHGLRPWADPRDQKGKRSREGGSMTVRLLNDDGMAIILPERLVRQILGGEVRSDEAFAQYDHANLFRKMLEENRPIETVRILAANPELGEPTMIEIEFGQSVQSLFYED